MDAPSTEILDLFVIGAGPHALGCVTRLFEHTPNALYTDVEHSRLHWLRKHVQSGNMKKRAVPLDVVEQGKSSAVNGKASYSSEKRPKVGVVDKQHAGWLGTWRQYFKSFEITNLRSPMFFHPHPGDLDALKSYAYEKGRQSELIEVGGVVGHEWSKHQKKSARIKGRLPRGVHVNMRSQDDYHTPSTPLFHSFIDESLIDHYSVASLVTKGTITSVSYSGKPTISNPNLNLPPTPPVSPSPLSDDEPLFTITIDGDEGQRTVQSRAVVMAIGPGAMPNVPDEFGVRDGTITGNGWCHTASFLRKEFVFPPVEVQQRMQGKSRSRCLVIGGGLTSAQIADLALRRGFSEVVLLCRSQLTVKPFDIGTEWMGKFSNLYKMIYFQEDDFEARLRMYKEARQGGSVNVPYHKRLKALISAGKVEIRTQRVVKSLTRREDATWDVEVVSIGKEDESEVLTGFDYIVSATGSKFSIDTLPFLAPLHKSHPIKTMGGFPVLTDDLQWRADIPFFVMGGYAGLHLGPGAPNLIGSREGAERIANGLAAAVPETWGEDASWKDEGHDNWRKAVAIGNSNMFAGLEEESE